MKNKKHLTQSERLIIEQSLNQSMSYRSIARLIGKNPSTISREVKERLIYKKSGCYGRSYNNCLNRINCTNTNLCSNPECTKRFCFQCNICSKFCNDYKKETCSVLTKPPYVCNGCNNQHRCTLEKVIYAAKYAQKEYEEILTESRSGINISESEMNRIDSIVSPLLINGHSLHNICVHNKDNLMVEERSLYNYVDFGLFSAKNIDMPRKVRFSKRKRTKGRYKVDKKCRINRTYKDFQAYLTKYPDALVVEMDSVEGTKGGKVLLTIHFKIPQLTLAYIRDANTSKSVVDMFNKLYLDLTPDVFRPLFPVVLGDNGSEFSNPWAIENYENNIPRTKVFYCDPSAPYQKGSLENNHEFIRRIIPKGKSFDAYEQEDINLMMSHINSYSRCNLGEKSPYEVFSSLYGDNLLEKLGINRIPNNDIILSPKLLK